LSPQRSRRSSRLAHQRQSLRCFQPRHQCLGRRLHQQRRPRTARLSIRRAIQRAVRHAIRHAVRPEVPRAIRHAVRPALRRSIPHGTRRAVPPANRPMFRHYCLRMHHPPSSLTE
jgi:hypothetical protein